MPLSRYLKIYPDQERADSYLLYSTIKGSIVRVSSSFLALAQKDSLAPSDRAKLIRLEMYVEDPEAELERMRGLVARTNQMSSKFRATVVLNLDCNLECVYCFEKGFREGNYMSEATGQLLVETVTRQHLDQGRSVELNFYGGEPILSLPLMKKIAAALQENARARGTGFSFGMVTNGTLLNRTLVEELIPLGFNTAQLTLDGPREIHDRQRPFASGSGSFDVIVANIQDIYELITLKLGGNYNQENYPDYPLMLDALLEAGIAPEKLAPVQFAPIRPESGNHVGEFTAHCCSSDLPWLKEAELYLREETLKRGFAVLKVTMGSCMVEFEHDLIINHDGTLYKCPSFMGWPELCVGTLEAGISDFSATHKLGIWKNETCLDCAYLPLCFGGCRLLPLLRNGVIDEVDCRKGFFDGALEGLILQELRYKSEGGARSL